ncbi:hypothetical protein EON81_20795 [bacterium]|nr:MAG: hypothetical protein EON81_20795 [bacterium]
MIFASLLLASFTPRPLAILPFEDRRGVPTFEMNVGGKEVSVILDTGMSASYIAQSKDSLESLTKTLQIPFSPTYTAPVTFVTWETKLQPGPSLFNRQHAGGLGADWAARYVLDLDYTRRRLTIWPPSTSLTTVIGSQTGRPRTIPLQRLDDGRYTFGMEIDGVSCTTMFDTGCGVVAIAPKTESRLGLKSTGQINVAMYDQVRRLKAVWPKRVTLDDRSVPLPNLAVVLPEDYLEDGIDALYGGDLLKPRTILDLGHRRIVLVDEEKGKARPGKTDPQWIDPNTPVEAAAGTVVVAFKDGRRLVRKIGESLELPADAKVSAIVEGVGARMGPEERTASGTIRVRILRSDRPKR